MPDEKAEALAIRKRFDGDAEGLANYLTRICICRAGLVYQVFQILDRYSTFDVSCRFAMKINKSSLYALAATRDGLILCKAVFDTLRIYRENHTLFNGVFLPPSCEGTDQTTQLFENVVNNPTPPKDENLEPRQLSECEMDYYANYNDSKDGALGGAKKPFKPDVNWQLPRQGIGYVVYTPDDLDNADRKRLGAKLLNDTYGYDQIGTKGTVEAMMRIAREWNALHPDRLLQYGDVARPGGINTPDHSEHNTGKAFDMRPLRKDGVLEALTYKQSAYSSELTKEFILLAVKLYPGTTIYFNDGVLANSDTDTKNIVDPSKDLSHDNHLHVMFPGGKE